MFGLFSKKWNPDGKHVYVTGGSSGLGLALSRSLAEQGAHISIVARDAKKLNEALESLEERRISPNQKFNAYSYGLATASGSVAALEAVCAPFDGECPDALMLCAGSSKPKFFVEMDEAEMVQGLDYAYWVQAWTAWAAAKKLSKSGKKGSKIVFVSSTVGYISFIGYASYAPGKHALRGLADTLSNELRLYDIGVHIYFPNTIYSPGFDQENITKPDITKQIEAGDDACTPERAATALLKGVVNGHVHITGDFNTSLLSASSRGSAPRSNWLLEGLYDLVAYIAVPIWRSSVDKQVTAHAEEHRQYLQGKGYFS